MPKKMRQEHDKASNMLMHSQLNNQNSQDSQIKANQNQNNQQRVSQLINDAIQNLQKQLEEGSITISKQNESNQENEKTQNKYTQRRLKQILQKKLAMQEQLAAIKQQEKYLTDSISIKAKNKNTESRVSSSPYYKSKLTVQDLQRLRILKLEGKRMEKQMEQKTLRYQNRLIEIKKEQEQAKQNILNQRYQLKKQEIEQTIQKIQKRKQQRSAKIQEQRKQLKQISHRKKLFQEWDRKYKAIEESQQKKNQQLRQQLRKMRKVSHEQIKQHDRKHQQVMRIHKQSRMKTIEKSDLEARYQSKFLDQIKQQERKRKYLQDLKKNQSKQFLQKIRQYSVKIKNEHKTSIKPKDKSATDQLKQQNELKSLSLYEMHEKGTSYMREANQKVIKALKQKSQNQPSQTRNHEIQQIHPKYKDYLKQLRKQQGGQNYKKKSEIQQIRQILDKQNMTKQQKLLKAKLISQKMQNNQIHHGSPSHIIKNINTKIQILQRIGFDS